MTLIFRSRRTRLIILAAIVVVTVLFVADSFYSRSYIEVNDVNEIGPMQNSIKVISFNAGLLDINLLGRSFLKPTDFLEERAAAMPSALEVHDADIVAIQEIYDKKYANDLIAALENSYPYHYRKDTTRVKIGNGLLLLSKFPIREQRMITYATGPWDEALFASKAIMSVQIALGEDLNLNVVNIHPTSGGMFNAQDSEKIMHIRQQQIRQAMEVGESMDGEFGIILGDFNSGPEIASDDYMLLGTYGYVDAYLHVCQKTALAPEMTWDATNFLNIHGTHSDSISQRIDHIFLSPGLAAATEIVESKVLFKEPSVPVTDENVVTISDHYGLIATLNFH